MGFRLGLMLRMGKKMEVFENEVLRRILVLLAGCEWHGDFWHPGQIITMAAPNRNYEIYKKNYNHFSNIVLLV
jgi:hypothetical protein